MTRLASFEDLSPYVGGNGLRETDRTFAERLLDACSARIIRYTGRKFFPEPGLVGDPPADTAAPVTKIFPVRRSAYVAVPDLREAVTVTLGGMALTPTLPYPAYELWGQGPDGDWPATHIKLLNAAISPYSQGPQLSITGRWGFLEIPVDISDSLCQWVARRFKQRDANYADTVQQGIEGAVFQYSKNLPADIKMTLDSFRSSGPKVALV